MTLEQELAHLQAQRDSLQTRLTQLVTENRALRGACEVRFTLAPGATAPTRGSDGAAGWDLYALTDTQLRPGQTRVVDTGVSLELPPHHEGQIRGRSGLSKAGLHVQIGTLDSDFRGACGVIMFNATADTYTVKAGDRIGQIIVATVPPLHWVEATSLGETARGANGWGSTGT